MATVITPRPTPRASNPATTSQTKTPKPVAPRDAALKDLGKVTDPNAPESLARLARVGSFVSSDADMTKRGAEVKSLTEKLADVRKERDSLARYRNDAILTALTVGFRQERIAETFDVSRGTVSHVSNARKVIAAVVARGDSAPALSNAVKAVSNAKASDVIAHAKSTGEVGLPDAPTVGTATGALQRVERASDYLRTVEWTADDAATLARLVEVSEHIRTILAGVSLPAAPVEQTA